MALTSDIKITRYGVVDAHTPLVYQLAAGTVPSPTTVYRGSVAGLRYPGLLVAMSSPNQSDIVVGMVANGGPGIADTGNGIQNTGASGTTPVEVATGTFLLLNSTGGDLLTSAQIGKQVFLFNENSVAQTSNGGTRPVAGVLVATTAEDPSIPTGYVAVTVGTASTFGAI